MFKSEPHVVGKPPTGLQPLGSLALATGGLAAGIILLCLGVQTPPFLPLLFFAAFVVPVTHGLVHRYPHPQLGLCNVITLTRAAMVAFLAGAIFDRDVAVWIVFGVAAVAFALDALDGPVARRSGLASDFGARFDMETDAALAAVLSLLLLVSGTTGPEILILGFMRYGFVLAGFAMPALRADLPASLRRKTVCAIQISALLFLLFPSSPDALLLPVSDGAALLLIWSFAVDTLWLLRRAA